MFCMCNVHPLSHSLTVFPSLWFCFLCNCCSRSMAPFNRIARVSFVSCVNATKTSDRIVLIILFLLSTASTCCSVDIILTNMRVLGGARLFSSKRRGCQNCPHSSMSSIDTHTHAHIAHTTWHSSALSMRDDNAASVQRQQFGFGNYFSQIYFFLSSHSCLESCIIVLTSSESSFLKF